MNIVCLSNLRDGAGYVARRVAETFPRTMLIQIVIDQRKSTWLRSLRRFMAGAWLHRLEHRCYYRGYYQRGSRRVEQLLYGSQAVGELTTVAQIRMSQINRPSTAAVLESLRPDLLLLTGAPLLQPHIFGIPRLAAINVHFGMSPHYRGEHTLFWPMYYRDYAKVGATIHLIDRGIDTGGILAQGCVALAAEDDEWSVEAKAAQLAAELIVNVLDGACFVPRWQPSCGTRGRNFNFRSRRLWHDAWFRFRRRGLGERPPATVEHVTSCCSDPPGALTPAVAMATSS